MVVTNRDMKISFTILFGEYKKKLYGLGVPTEKIGDKQLIEWFQQHLRDIGDTENE